MNLFKNLFQSEDSKYFIKTATKITAVPMITLGLIYYSLWLYLEMNYSFFLANGLAGHEFMKEAFLDNILASRVEDLPFIGLFFVGVFFLGLFLAHLVLRPFNQVAQMCHSLLVGEVPNTDVQGISGRKLVVRSATALLSFLISSNTKNNEIVEFDMPQDIKKIAKPKVDGVFYFQYGTFVIILSAMTGLACHFFTHHLHEAIIDSATIYLKSNRSVATFLTSQIETIEMVAWISSTLSFIMYASIAKSLIATVEGTSYAYLRDIKDIVYGDYSKRLSTRINDPGRQAALEINQLMDKFYPQSKAVDHENNVVSFQPHLHTDVPPSFIQDFESKDGIHLYKVLTPDGHTIEGLSYDEVLNVLKKVG